MKRAVSLASIKAFAAAESEQAELSQSWTNIREEAYKKYEESQTSTIDLSLVSQRTAYALKVAELAKMDARIVQKEASLTGLKFELNLKEEQRLSATHEMEVHIEQMIQQKQASERGRQSTLQRYKAKAVAAAKMIQMAATSSAN